MKVRLQVALFRVLPLIIQGIRLILNPVFALVYEIRRVWYRLQGTETSAERAEEVMGALVRIKDQTVSELIESMTHKVRHGLLEGNDVMQTVSSAADIGIRVANEVMSEVGIDDAVMKRAVARVGWWRYQQVLVDASMTPADHRKIINAMTESLERV